MTSASPKQYAVAFSSGLRALKHIARFLEVESIVSPKLAARRNLPLSCVVVWGRKQNAKSALEFAQSRGLPIRYVEDGWIRSCSENAHSRTSYSLLIDYTGVYYDSRTPSDLENYLNLPDAEFKDQCDDASVAYARSCRELMVEHSVTKYNFCPSANPAALDSQSRSLVIVADQTLDDASVRYGALDAKDFLRLLDRAMEENAGARIVVRTHPDVIAGKRKGYLTDYAKQKGVEVTAVADNPMDWLKQAKHVYVGTSQLGYEALMCGCQVSVAGLPFYAGWGLTRDFQSLARRKRSRTLDQLFYATHIHLARYRDPITGNAWSLHECIDHVLLQQACFRRNAHRFACVGITPWKRRYLSQYLRSPAGQVRFCQATEVETGERAVYWSFRNNDTATLHSGADAADSSRSISSVSRMEDGFIRSRGLGSDFVAPASLVIDHSGLYFDPAKPSDLETLLNNEDCSEAQLARARSIRESLLSSRLTKYNVGRVDGDQVTEPGLKRAGQQKILVVGQVEDDQSIKRGCTNISSNASLCEAVRVARPNAYIVYKPHPDVESGNRQGAVPDHVLSRCIDHVEKERHFLDCLEYSDELHTMTSLSGFEALLRGKSVFTYGMPFYAGWGLTNDVEHCGRRQRRRSLDELVYLCLVAYPSYLDVATGEFITVEQLIAVLRESRPLTPDKQGEIRRLWAKCSNIRQALTYNP